MSEIKYPPSKRERSLGRWKDWIKEHMHERGEDRRGRLEQARRGKKRSEIIDRFMEMGHH